MSIQNQIDRLAGAKTTIGNYLQQNGVAVPSGATLDEMALQLADVIEKQNKITAAGILKGDGKGGVSAATPGTDYLKTAPVTSVNGATGAIKTNWYFNVTGSVASPSTTQTAAQIVAAQEAGFAPICSATFSDFQGLPATLPALLISSMACVFGGIGSTGGNTFYLTVMIDGAGTLTAKTDDVAAKGDIPTSLKNPNALSIKVGDNTTSYDGSAAKSVEIPEQTYSLTETDKEDIAADVIAGGQEVQVGEPLAGPTDAQVSSAVNTWLTEHPEATTTVQDGSVSVEKLGYGKHVYGSKPYFCNSVGSGAQVYGSLGVVVPCKAGDTIYTNITVPTNASWNVPKILTAFPENQYGDIASITLENLAVNNDTKQYAIGADKTTAKALYIPDNFQAIPAANNGSVEDALAWINKFIGTNGSKCAQNVPFEDCDAWYQTAQTELFDIDESCNKLMYASLYQAVSRLVGAKVAVLGDSLTEQSACSLVNANQDQWMVNACRDATFSGDDGKTYVGSGWFAMIARKYKIKWWCAGHGMQWWYSTTARPNGATAMVRKLIDGTDEFDYIVLEYGTNDILSGYTHIGTAADEASETATTSCGAIKWCIEQLQMRFPEASIVVILPNIHSGANGEAPATQQAYLDAVVPILKKYGVRRVNMAEDSGIVKSMMSTDGVHLRWPVVSNNVTYYTNDTPAVRKFSKCLEAELLKA
nr:MAG TPA: hydrolase [Caudoviricetes sp.]